MKGISCFRWQSLRVCGAVGLALLLAACGGGGGAGQNASMTVPPVPSVPAPNPPTTPIPPSIATGIVRVNVPAGQSGSITLFNNASQNVASVTTTADVVVPAGSYSLRYQPAGYADPLFWNGAAQTFDPSASRPITVSAGQVYVATFTAAQMTDAQVSALAVQRMNYYRTLVGLTPVIEDVNLRQAALNHANYWFINRNDPSVAGLGAHNETVGFAGFTGVGAQNRYAFVTGISPTTWYVSEDMYFGLYPVLATVDGWMNTVYHQLPIMDNMLLYAGMGRYYQGTAGSTTLNMGIGFPVVARSLYVYPANGQQDVFAQFSGGEMPDPLLNSGLTYPVGSPISLYAPGHVLTVNTATLTETTSGTALGVLTLNSATDPNRRLNASTVFFIPRLSLKPQTSYTMTVNYNLDGGVATNYTWSFTTGWQ